MSFNIWIDFYKTICTNFEKKEGGMSGSKAWTSLQPWNGR